MADITIESDFDIHELGRSRGHTPIPTDGKVHVDDMSDQEAALIRKTVAQMPHIPSLISYTNPRSLDGRASIGPVDSILPAPLDNEVRAPVGGITLDPAEETDPNIVLQAVTEHPNLAWEAIKMGLMKERVTNDQLNAHIKEAEKHQKDIDLLLDFNAEMSGFKDDGTELSQRAKELLEELRERGIDLWKGEDKTVNKERVSSMKELSSNHIDKSRSKLQNLVLTKIQPKIANIGAIMETLKDIMRNHTKLMNTVTGNMGKR
jgi:hypothetical protein